MAAQSKVVSSRTRKSKSIPVVTNVVQLDSQRKKEYEFNKWKIEFNEFYRTLSKPERDLVRKKVDLISETPTIKKPESSEVIQFPTR